jgi:transposase
VIQTGHVQVWVSSSPVDMRKSFDSLAEHVRTFLGHDPLSGNLFVFRGKRSTRLKILWWDQNGLAIYYKRLEKGTFALPALGASCAVISRQQLTRLIRGMEWAE